LLNSGGDGKARKKPSFSKERESADEQKTGNWSHKRAAMRTSNEGGGKGGKIKGRQYGLDQRSMPAILNWVESAAH